MYIFCFNIIFYFSFNSKTNVVTNLNPLNLDKKFISLFLIESSLSFTCSSRLKEFKISTL